MDRVSPSLPMVADAATGISPARRWAADPLALLLLTASLGLVGSVLAWTGALPGVGSAAWAVPALFGVVVAGLALSGST